MKYYLCALLTFCSIHAGANVSIIGIDIPGLHDSKGGGAYDQIINEAAVSTGLASLKVFPPARAEAQFASCTNCCFSPANKNQEFYDFGADITQTLPMNVAKIYIFSPPGSAEISSLSALKGKKVGIRTGMPYGKTFDAAGLKTSAVSDIGQNIKKVQGKRLDAFIAYIPDAYIAFKDMGISPFPHAKSTPIAVHEDSLVCRGVSASFIESFNTNLQKMKTDGKLKAVLGDTLIEN